MSRNLPKGRSDLLKWLNRILKTNFTMIEQLRDGVGYCLLFDCALRHVDLPLDRLNLNANNKEQYKHNLHVLEVVFGENRIPKRIPISELASGKLQTHVHFLQWACGYLTKTHMVHTQTNYDGIKKLTMISKRKKAIKLIGAMEEEMKIVLTKTVRDYDRLKALLEKRQMLVGKLKEYEDTALQYPTDKHSVFIQDILKKKNDEPMRKL